MAIITGVRPKHSKGVTQAAKGRHWFTCAAIIALRSTIGDDINVARPEPIR